MNAVTTRIRDAILCKKGLKYSAKQRLSNSTKRPLELYWYRDLREGVKNFGDEYSQDLITTLFGYRIHHASHLDCEFVATGSNIDFMILNRASDSADVNFWGSGFIQKDEVPLPPKNMHFYAVRGELSLSRIGNHDEIPLGDPGILANIVYKTSGKKSGKIGIIPHYVDLDSDFIKKIEQDERFTIISPLQAPSDVAEQISQCDMIFSSSLHGLIFADSLNIPNAHISLSDKVIGGPYKFKDYCTGVSKRYLAVKPEEILDGSAIEKTKTEYQPIENLEQRQRALVAAFPYK